MRRRPDGWVAPGPIPPGDSGCAELRPQAGETLDCLSGHWRIFQLRRGHRYSTDDLLTAWYAAARCHAEGRQPGTLLDLGCGIGSVMLLLLWRFPRLCALGIEAQPASVALARRSARFNGAEGRVVVREADFREPRSLGPDEVFDLVTASPPYLGLFEGRRSALPQRGPCRFEDRGGALDYLAVAAAHATSSTLVVWVHATRYVERVLEAADAAGLRSVTWRRVQFREGRESLISLFSAKRSLNWRAHEEEVLAVRDCNGSWSDEYMEVRRQMGFPGF